MSKSVSADAVAVAVACTFSLGSVASYAAVAVAKEGKYDDMICYAGVQQALSPVKGQIAGSYHVYGSPVPKQGDLFLNMSGQCIGVYKIIGDEFLDTGACSFTDADGDAFFGTYVRAKGNEPGQWKVTGGTGKYEGMQSTGGFMPETQIPSPTGVSQLCVKGWGSWKLR